MFSFSLHVLVLILYFINKTQKYFMFFLATSFSNIIVGIALTIYSFKNPHYVRSLNFDLIIWVLSGFITLIMIVFKTVIILKVIRRMKDPGNYSINFFGKKVYGQNVIQKKELGTLFLTTPVFLIVGAYFFAKLYHFLLRI